jgi:hypothetical protein
MPPPPGAPPPPPPWYNAAVRRRVFEEPHVGLGIGGTGFSFGDTQLGGASAHLRVRASHNVTWELALGVMGGKDEMGIERRDVPLTLGVHIYPWDSVLAPYFVAAGGGNFVREDFQGQHIDGTQFVGALGGGLELRLGHHLTLGGDVRYQWRELTDRRDGSQSYRVSGLLPPLRDEDGTAYNLTATYYF